MGLPVNIVDLLSGKTIETDRIEFKEGWNPDSIYRTVCAFANDFDNSGGGYILIGVKEENGVGKRPVKGLQPEEIAMELLSGPVENSFPRNVGLMLFTEMPEK